MMNNYTANASYGTNGAQTNKICNLERVSRKTTWGRGGGGGWGQGFKLVLLARGFIKS